MRLPLMCTLVATSSLAACGGVSGPKTTQEVGDKVVAALVAKDWTALKPLYVTTDTIKSSCSAMPADKLEGLQKELAEEATEAEGKFKECLGIDWTGAKVTAVSGGEAKKPVEGCDKLTQSSDIELKVDVGGKSYDVKVNDPALIDGHYTLVEGIRCKKPELSCDDVYDNMVKIVSAAADAKEGEKAMFSGAADKKTEFGKMCGEMRGNPTFASIIACVGEAKNYGDMKACEDKAKGANREEAAEKPAPVENVAPPAGGAAAPAAPAATDDAACTKFYAKYDECLAAMPEMQREGMKKGLEQVKAGFASAPAEGKAAMCSTALTQSKASLGQLCPAVVWE